MTRILEGIAVGIPARDEADRIEACLRSVLGAARLAEVPIAVVVAADACRDQTAAIAAAVLAEADGVAFDVVVTDHRSAGAARATALDGALALLGRPPEGTWLVTTDADTVVDASWLAAHAAWARGGLDGVAGLVRVDWEDAPPELPDRYAASIAPGGITLGHRHVHGANLGVIGSRWVEVGGCGPGPVSEDHELWVRLKRVGATVLGVDDLIVTTSGRLRARAPRGFAHLLAELAADGDLEEIA